VLDRTAELAMAGVAHGAYVLEPASGETSGETPDVVLVGTGSEVAVCLEARKQLVAQGIAASVVSMPSWELFEAQEDGYRVDVLPPTVPSLAVEAGARLGWERYVDDVVSIDRFGASAPGKTALTNLGINPEHVVARALELLGETR
jgi:transketolase